MSSEGFRRQINAVRPDDAGEYKCACVARNILPRAETVGRIFVRGKVNHLHALVSFRWLFQILPHLIESSLASCGLKMGHQKYPKLYESIDLWNLIPDHRYDINIRICMGQICTSHGKRKNFTIIHFQ